MTSGTLKAMKTEVSIKSQIRNGTAFNEPYNILAPLPALGAWKLSSKKSAVLPTTTAAYLAMEAAAAKYAPKAAAAAAAAQKEWWDAIEIAGDVKASKGRKRKHTKKKTSLRAMMKDQKRIRSKKVHLTSINLLHKQRKLLRTRRVHRATGNVDLRRDG